MSKKPELEHKWFFPGNKQAWLLICCNFLLYLVKTAITYLFHGPPQHRCYSVCPFSERRAGCVCVRAHARVHVLQSNLSQVFPLARRTLRSILCDTPASSPPAPDNDVPVLTVPLKVVLRGPGGRLQALASRCGFVKHGAELTNGRKGREKLAGHTS